MGKRKGYNSSRTSPVARKISIKNILHPDKPGAQYFLSLSHPSALSAEDYVTFQAGLARNQPAKVSKEWNDWMDILKEGDTTQWKEAAKQAPKLSKQKVKDYLLKIDPGPSLSLNMPRSRPSSPIPESAPASSPSAPKSPKSSSASPTSSSSTSSSSSALTPGAIERMRSEFSSHFKEHNGATWVLSSGTNVDQVIYAHVMKMVTESTLHSFILDHTEPIVQYLDEADRPFFQVAIDDHDSGITVATLPKMMQDELLRYSLTPEALQDLLRHGWKGPGDDKIVASDGDHDLERFRKVVYRAILCLSSLYEDHKNQLPDSKSESWYITEVWAIFMKLLVGGNDLLKYEPGEVCSSASSLRKNNKRQLDTRHSVGRKIDGLVICSQTVYEIGAVEMGKVDEGSTGTKVLKDGIKLAKVLKDMFDIICDQCYTTSAIKDKLEVYGILVSGLRVEFVSLRYMRGRFYRLTREHTISIPMTWTERSIRKTLVVVTKFLQLRKRMETMAKLIEDRCNPDTEELKNMVSGVRPSTPPRHPQTLSTPIHSPKRRR
ncbi:hypothetical protein BGX28_006250 [Mortierella sp. GBA30]|nr:hypothetical protein BGX28_006250 [Mortierella sp. GBA30]